jgi:hypothetical protein
MSHPTPEEAELLINENRFLKQTIITLREELTKKEFETQDIIDGKQSDFQKESKVLKSIIEKLRLDIENNLSIHEEEKQDINKKFHNEHKQLRKLVLDLRTSLEKTK